MERRLQRARGEPAPPPSWPPLDGPALPVPGEVLLVCAPLDLSAAVLARLTAGFSPRERMRAARYATADLRARWSAGRGILRQLLALASGADPAALRFSYGEHGKPALDPASAPPLAGPPLTFNVSHSHGLGLYALGRGVELGVDIERIQERRSDGVANRFFHAEESAFLRALPEEPRREAFFALWCAKEALIKASGAGLSQSLSSFCFSLDAGGPTAVRWHREGPEAARRWAVHRLLPADGFRGALVAAAGGLSLRCRSLRPA